MPAPDPVRDAIGQLQDRRIVLGVSGSISAYKAVDLASALVQSGAVVDVILTQAALQFITPLSFVALTGRPVHVCVFDGWDGGEAGHVGLARNAEAMIVAPASANTIARLAHGLVDDMLTAVALFTPAPILVAPAMEHHMWHHPATQANVRTLQSRSVTVIHPDRGRLASGAMGDGRLPARETLITALVNVFQGTGALAGRKVVVTAGGTREPLDPVRYLGNRSSGQMGIALARAAREAGADVRLIATESVGILPDHIDVTRVATAAEMMEAVEEAVENADVLIMAAAVADFRPAMQASSKIKKSGDAGEMVLRLVKNPDILTTIQAPGLIKVGFAAETDALIEHASKKLERKGLAMIVANDAVRTIGSNRSEATLLFANRPPIQLAEGPKPEVARSIIREVVTLVDQRDEQD